MARREKPKTVRLTIYLLKEEVEKPEDSLSEDEDRLEQPLDPTVGIDGIFYYTSRPPRPTGWSSFVKPILENDIQLQSSSASGLLVLRAANRFFALTFSYGRSLLDYSKVETQFGLRVCLNRINPTQIRSMDTKAFEDMMVVTSTQVSKYAELPTFGIDVAKDILRTVTGKPGDSTFAARLSGGDALVVGRSMVAADLPAYCADLLNAFNEDTYKENFGWVDQLTMVKDKSVVVELDNLVVQQLASGDTAKTHMAPPEVLVWADIDVFRIAGTRDHEYEDLDLDEYLDVLGDGRNSLTLQQLKSRAVSVKYTRVEDFDSPWKLYGCLVSEQHINDQLYVLIEGQWFRVANSLVEEVDGYVSELQEAGTPLLLSKRSEKEGEYNLRLADSNVDHLLHLDAKIKRPGGASSGIELCDVLSDRGEFIHVKRKTSSSTLSHLFGQGTVSATTFMSDSVFRDEIRTAIAQSKDLSEDQKEKWLGFVPSGAEQVDRSRYSVAYVVITDRGGDNWLPFFSKLNLMQHGKRLTSMGFPVHVSRVGFEAASPSSSFEEDDSR